MPQLDFFSFSNQFFYTIICFCGLYYFNLFILFPRIKWLYADKSAFCHFIGLDEIFDLDESSTESIGLSMASYGTFNFYINYLEENIDSFFFKNVSFTKKEVASANTQIIFFSIVMFLFTFIFTKNLIEFNAEKLMLTYFLIVFSILLIAFSREIKFFLENETKNYLIGLIELYMDRSDKYEQIGVLTKKITEANVYIFKKVILTFSIKFKNLLNA